MVRVELCCGLDAGRHLLYTWKFQIGPAHLRAEVAELADAQASGACGRKVVEVQILSSAPIHKYPNRPRENWALQPWLVTIWSRIRNRNPKCAETEERFGSRSGFRTTERWM
jgi:hypothetical protein